MCIGRYSVRIKSAEMKAKSASQNKKLLFLLSLNQFSISSPVSAASVIPPVPRDNSHYVEGESRYVWIPSGEGELRLVDLQQPVDELMLTAARNGANNAYWLFTR